MDDRLWRLDMAPKNIYVATTILNQGEALRLASELQRAGFNVTSRWLEHDHSGRPTKDDWAAHVMDREWYGNLDLEDLEMSDTLIILADKPSATGGYHVELGYFLGANRSNIIVVGDRPNVFYWLEDVRYVHCTRDLVEWLKDPSHGQGLTLPPVLDEFKRGGKLEDQAATLPVDDLLSHYMEPAVAAISSKIEEDLLRLYAGFVDDAKVHAGTDAFACSMRANWLEAERRISALEAKNEKLRCESILQNYDKFVDDFWFLGNADLQMPEDAYLGLCLAGEAGEVAEKLKKAYRDQGGAVDPDSMVRELGDVLYYLVRYAHLLGSDLENVARKNVEKLQDRAARSKLRGEGDGR